MNYTLFASWTHYYWELSFVFVQSFMVKAVPAVVASAFIGMLLANLFKRGETTR